MENKRMKSYDHFEWTDLGDIDTGRMSLGGDIPVAVYRLMEYTMKDVLIQRYGKEETVTIFHEAGYLAGAEFAKNTLDLEADFSHFMAELQNRLVELKIGILRIEQFDETDGAFVLTVSEDADCSGLEPTGETVCYYDEGFLAGVLETYTNQPYEVTEVDCWATGDRVCRFKGKVRTDA